MDPITNFVSSIGGSTASQIINSTFSRLENSGDEMTVDQAVAIGLLKSYGDLFPEFSEWLADISVFAQDYETLRHAGFSSGTAHEIASFIYSPRRYLIQNDYFEEEFVMRLDQDTIETIVDNSLREFLDLNGVSIDNDLEFDIAGMEGSDPDLEELDI